MILTFNINGEDRAMEARPDKRLIDFLRDDLGLLSVHEGCGAGECGACTVIVNGDAVNSCLMMAGQIDGAEVFTAEGLEKDGELDALQQSFIDHSAVQCGFCTPGMLMSAKALLMRNPDPTREEIREALAGNICRCTGYKEILSAVEAVAGQKAEV